MKTHGILLAGALALLALPAIADDATGKWSGSVETPDGPFQIVFDLKTEGEKLTGAFSNEFMPAAPISEGIVKGNEVAFKLAIAAPDGSATITISYKGTVKGNELSLTSTFEGEPPGGGPADQTLILKRAQ